MLISKVYYLIEVKLAQLKTLKLFYFTLADLTKNKCLNSVFY